MSTVEHVITGIIDTCSRELFAAYGVELTRVSDPRTTGELMLCGILGFAGAELRGAIVIAGGETPFVRTNPIAGLSHRAWCSELTNQLVGRIKNDLIARGVEIHLSLPVVLGGSHIAPLPRRELPPLAYRSGDDVLCIWMELEHDPDLVLGEPVHTVADEGSALLF